MTLEDTINSFERELKNREELENEALDRDLPDKLRMLKNEIKSAKKETEKANN